MACGKIEGADPPTLAKRVQELAAERVAEKAKADGLDGMQPELQAKLKKLIRCGLAAVRPRRARRFWGTRCRSICWFLLVSRALAFLFSPVT